MKREEKQIQEKIIKWLNKQPYTIVHKRFANAYNAKGMPDITGAIGGLCLEIEVKTETGVLSPKQEYYIRKFREHCVIIIVARDLETVQRELSPVYEAISKGILPFRF